MNTLLSVLKGHSPKNVCELFSLGDIGCRDFFLMGRNDALNVVLTAPKNTFEKLNSNVSFQKLWYFTQNK